MNFALNDEERADQQRREGREGIPEQETEICRYMEGGAKNKNQDSSQTSGTTD